MSNISQECDILVNILSYPLNLPHLFSSYIMNEKKFNRYLPLFDKNETIKCDFELEIYLPDCEIIIHKEREKINSFRDLFSSNKYGNFDILDNLDRYIHDNRNMNKKQKLTDQFET